MSHPLYAVQQIRRLRGGSQAQLLRASDGGYYVTKSAQNPQHVRVLAIHGSSEGHGSSQVHSGHS